MPVIVVPVVPVIVSRSIPGRTIQIDVVPVVVVHNQIVVAVVSPAAPIVAPVIVAVPWSVINSWSGVISGPADDVVISTAARTVSANSGASNRARECCRAIVLREITWQSGRASYRARQRRGALNISKAGPIIGNAQITATRKCVRSISVVRK